MTSFWSQGIVGVHAERPTTCISTLRIQVHSKSASGVHYTVISMPYPIGPVFCMWEWRSSEMNQ
jgi:hypothetical protein